MHDSVYAGAEWGGAVMSNRENKQTDPPALVQAEDVKRVFGKGEGQVTVLKNIELSIPAGSLTALKGRSGSGKTTLLNLLGALDRPTEGTILFGDRELTTLTENERSECRRRSMGLIFQSFALIPMMSAYENVEFGLRIAGIPAKLRKERALSALEYVGLTSRMSHRPFEMSGGEQQRTAIARAIAHRPTLLLADEPTAELELAFLLVVPVTKCDRFLIHGNQAVAVNHRFMGIPALHLFAKFEPTRCTFSQLLKFFRQRGCIYVEGVRYPLLRGGGSRCHCMISMLLNGANR